MLDWHPYDSTCNCEPCKVRTLSQQERPDCASAPAPADPVGEIIARCSGPLPAAQAERLSTRAARPSLAHYLEARARREIKAFPDLIIVWLAAWQELGIQCLGDSPAARSASDTDLRNAVSQQLSLLADLRAKLAVARDLARQFRSDLEGVLSDLRRRGTTGAGSDRSILELAEHRIEDVLHDEPTVDDALAGLQVDAALTRAGEAVPRG